MTATSTPALGIVLVPTLPPEALRPLAAAADRHLDELWLWEDCFKESSIAAAGAALAWTERVRDSGGRVGTSTTPSAGVVDEVIAASPRAPGSPCSR